MIVHKWHQQNFWLCPHRVMYWEEEKTLIVSDLHFGKTGHFRKHGIAIPQDIYKEDLQRLFATLQHFQPKKLLIVGDLFHSHANKELDWFCKWRNDFATTEFMLVMGNHDILTDEWYAKNEIRTSPQILINGIYFVHDLETDADNIIESAPAIICGHVHPSITIKTGPKQQVRLPCFYFNSQVCTLPAFSHFTGTYSVKPKKGNHVFAISNKEIILMKY